MWECGTLGQRIGQDNTWANNSISGFTPLQIHLEMNTLFQKMPFFVAEPLVVALGLFDSVGLAGMLYSQCPVPMHSQSRDYVVISTRIQGMIVRLGMT